MKKHNRLHRVSQGIDEAFELCARVFGPIAPAPRLSRARPMFARSALQVEQLEQRWLMSGSVLLDPANMSVSEDDGTVTFCMTYTGTGGDHVDYETVDGTAKAGEEFTGASGTISFPTTYPTAYTFTVTLIDDELPSVNSAFSVHLL